MEERLLFSGGLVLDGTGAPGYRGDVLVAGDKILCVSNKPLTGANARAVDCAGMAVAPGFIDAHSHNDQLLYLKDELTYTEPFIRQGITTYVGGNCGFSPAGMAGDHAPNLLLPNGEGVGPWGTYEAYFAHMRAYGMRQNLAMLAGHNTALSSVAGLTPPGDTPPAAFKRVAALLEEGLDNGCKGLSVGLGYRPGQFVSDGEIRAVAELAIRRDKVVAVHSRALNAYIPSLYGEDCARPHNVRWHDEFIKLFVGSGAKLQISHLVFCGEKAWGTYGAMLDMLEGYMRTGGLDLWFDMYSYRQGATSISVLLNHAPYFYENLSDIYSRPDKAERLEEELMGNWRRKGFLPGLMMLCGACCEKWRPFQGKRLPAILEETGLSMAAFCMDLYRESGGGATVYFLFEQEEANVPRQMAHPRALYMTDAWVQPGSHQNACAFGSLPRFLRLARESGLMTLEAAVAHMTGLTADRFGLAGRGYLRPGYSADLVVFDPARVRERATEEEPAQYPEGIREVYVNGVCLLRNGLLQKSARPGRIL